MNVKRLVELADFLETIPPERFKMYAWASINFNKDNCDTAACAAGWACVLFENLGLRFVYSSFHDWPSPYFDGFQYEDALEKFFDLTYDQVENIFFQNKYPDYNFNPSSQVVAERIREIIKKSDEVA